MRTIGLIGGMSWESSLEYYRLINTMVQERMGGFHSAKLVMVSVDFAEVEAMQMSNRWDDATGLLVTAAQQTKAAGADFVLLCTNTMHKVAGAIEAALAIPLLHIADAAAVAVQAHQFDTVGLLGTRFTMEEAFYRQRLADKYGLRVLMPDASDREVVHQIIYDELVKGRIVDHSRQQYQNIIQKLSAQGAQGVILGCTEIGLLIKATDSPIPVFDTTILHASAAVTWALDGIPD
ncbi:MAG: aspartate/glutamate racemase family protein [Chloroflexi bacterium]|nr:aspartate/glutamate racemase family protein [Chloroflexota bacterium]